MADRFQNGLHLTSPAASQCGRTLSRWLVEFLTQVCGWTVVQAVAGNWTNTVASGSGGASVTGAPRRFSIGSGYTFSSATDVGAYLTITGFTGRYASRNGVYRIERVISDTVVELEVERSLHEDGFPRALSGLAWRLWRPTASYVPTSGDVIVLKGHGTTGAGYDYHLHINVRSSNCYFPEFRISPWAGWLSPGWADGRVIAATGMDSYSNSLSGTDDVYVWAAGDADRVTWMMRTDNDYYSWHFGYLGEIDPKDALNDPRPCVIWTGSNAGVSGVGDDVDTFLGYGSVGTILSGGKWLSFDDTTTVTGYAMIACTSPTTDNAPVITGSERRWNELSRLRIRQPILCECRTANYMEVRGALRRVWATCRGAQINEVQGVNGEYLHLKGGIVLPWCNTKAWYGRG